MGVRLRKGNIFGTVSMLDMKVGQFGEIADSCSAHQGSIVFKSKSKECVMLDAKDGNYSDGADFQVRILQLGEVLEITE